MVGIASHEVIPGDPTYREEDRRVGLALFDAAYRRRALAQVSANLIVEEPLVHARAAGRAVAALAS